MKIQFVWEKNILSYPEFIYIDQAVKFKSLVSSNHTWMIWKKDTIQNRTKISSN